MIFSYWTEDPGSENVNKIIENSMSAWRLHYPDTILYSDSVVSEMFSEIGSDFLDTYKRIRIPACKSDVARLMLLYKFGGLYVDIHCGPGGPDRLQEILGSTDKYELVVFDKVWDRSTAADIHIINTAIGARKKSPILKDILDRILANLQAHDKIERFADRYVPYNIAVLSGAWNFRLHLFKEIDGKIGLQNKFLDKVRLIEMERGRDYGIEFYKHYSYRKAGRHWSERQKSESLFTRA